MAEYLLPYSKLTTEEKRKMFSVRNRMVLIPANYPKKNPAIAEYICFCGQREVMSHVYSCKYFSDKQQILEYEAIYNGNLFQQITVFKQFHENYETRNRKIIENTDEKIVKKKTKNGKVPHVILSCDPLNYVELSNG